MIEESDCEYEEGSHVASYDENYIPAANDGTDTPKDSNIEQEMIIEQEEEYDSNESVEDEPVSHNVSSIWTTKDETEWDSNPLPSTQTRSNTNISSADNNERCGIFLVPDRKLLGD